jgi:hypothetical protein
LIINLDDAAITSSDSTVGTPIDKRQHLSYPSD